MFSILDTRRDGPLFRWTFSTHGLDEDEWHHSAVAHDLVAWVDEVLLPFAEEKQGYLKPEEVVRQVIDLATRDRVFVTGIDWLGLALLAAERYREWAAKLAYQDSDEVQRKLSAAVSLSKVLDQVHHRIARVLHATLRDTSLDAA